MTQTSACPDCEAKLERFVGRHGILDRCPSCEGAIVRLPVLRRALSRSVVSELWEAVGDRAVESSRKCPSCGRALRALGRPGDGFELCRSCQLAWLPRQVVEETGVAHARSASDRALGEAVAAAQGEGEAVVREARESLWNHLWYVLTDWLYWTSSRTGKRSR